MKTKPPLVTCRLIHNLARAILALFLLATSAVQLPSQTANPIPSTPGNYNIPSAGIYVIRGTRAPGTITGSMTDVMLIIDSDGRVNSSGNALNFIKGGAVVHNTGTVVGSSDYGVFSATNPSSVTNYATGLIQGGGASINMRGGGTVTNSGRIIGTTYYGISGSGVITITNSAAGLIQGDSTGIYINYPSNDATLMNSGSIVGTKSIGVSGVSSVTNGTTGLIQGFYTGVTGVVTLVNDGTITITNTDPKETKVRHTVSISNGSVTNNETGLIRGYFTGIYMTSSGTVYNSGTILSDTYKGIDSISHAGTRIVNGTTGLIQGLNDAISFYDSGTVTNSGSIISLHDGINGWKYAVITNNDTGLIRGLANGITMQDGSTVTNSGTIIGTGSFGINARLDYPLVYLDVAITNDATGLIQGGVTGIYFEDSGTVTNGGIITGSRAYGVRTGSDSTIIITAGLVQGGSSGIFMGDRGTVTNEGVITGSLAYGIAAGDDATVTNNAMRVIRGGATGIYMGTGGAVTNSGTIIGTQSRGIEGGNDTIIINNVTSLIHGGTTGIFMGTGGTVTNSGVISGTRAHGIYAGNNITITNTTTGLIRGGTFGIFMGDGGTVTNSGVISGDGYGSSGISMGSGGVVANSSTILGSGYNGSGITGSNNTTITNSSTGLIQGGWQGIYLKGSGTITNSGTIIGEGTEGIDGWDNVTITNDVAGLIQGGNFGISMWSGGTVTNSGTIINSADSWYDGIEGWDDATITNNATGLIQGVRHGIKVGNNNTVINSGTIIGTDNSGIFGDDDMTITNTTNSLIQGRIYGIYLGGGGAVTNSGTITGVSDDGILAGDNVTITNNAGGLIRGGTTGIFMEIGGAVTNSGTILGSGSAAISGGNDMVVTNSAAGLVQGGKRGIYMLDGGTITNSGAIIGTESHGIWGGDNIIITNAATGLIQGGSTGIFLGNGGTLTNSGTILGDIKVGDDTTIINDESEIQYISMGSGGAVTNDGTISSGINAGDNTTITNNAAGLLQSGTAGISLGDGGTITNSGTILGMGMATYGDNDAQTDFYGILAGNNTTVTNNTTGLVRGGTAGIFLEGGGAVTNSGTILGTGPNSYGIIANNAIIITNTASGLIEGDHGVKLVNGGTVYNAGTISGTSTIGAGVYSDASASTTLVSNTTGGLIQGNYQGVYLGSGGMVANAGVISGTGANGIGVYTNANATLVSNTTGGLIQGVSRGVALWAGGTLTNAGTISGTGSGGVGVYSHAGIASVNNAAGGLIQGVNRGVQLAAGGTLTNTGTIDASSASGFGVHSSSNATLVSNTTGGLIRGGLRGVFFAAGGTLINAGVITGTGASGAGVYSSANETLVSNTTGGLIQGGLQGVYLWAGGTLANSGTIIGDGVSSQGIYGGSNATITNDTGGLIRGGTAGIQMVVAGTVINRGTITGTTDLTSGIFGGDDATITNAAGGLIQGSRYGIRLGTGGTITNSGTIIGSSQVTSYGIASSPNVTITNSTTGLIQGEGSGISLTVGATVMNSGTILGMSYHGVISGRDTTITNAATGLIQGGASALYTNGAVRNSGTLIGGHEGIQGGASAIITNDTTGLIQGSTNGVYLGDSGTVDNSGTIRSTIDYGVRVNSGKADVTNNAGGVIDGGIYAGGTTKVVNQGLVRGSRGVLIRADSTLANTGTIDVTGTAVIFEGAADFDNGGFIRGSDTGVHLAVGGTITNSGTIIGTGASGHGIYGGANATITNDTGGSIRGGTAGISILSGGTVTNSGTIRGTGAASYGISASNSVIITNTTGGLIQGAIAGIHMQDGGTVTNAGVISGTRNSFYGGGYGVYSANTSAHITNGVTGLMRGESAGVELAAGGVIINSGSIISTAYYYTSDAVGVRGGGAPVQLTNNATGLISGDRFGVRLADGGEITNSGTIKSDEYAVTSINESMLVTNTTGGLITGDRAGVLLQAGGTVANSGTIDGAVGVHAINTGVEIANATGGLIQGGTLGLRLQAGGGVTNSGTIIGEAITGISSRDEATITNDATGLIQGGMFGIFLGSGGTVTNSGAIRAPGVPGDFYAFGIEAEDEAVITNNAGGLIQGADVGVGLVNGGTLTNSGTISGITDAGIFAEEGRAIITNTTGGVISGGTYAIDLFDDAAHEVHLWNSSTLLGHLAIAGDASQLVLNGASGSESLYSSAVTGSTTFTGTLIKQGGGAWTIDTAGLAMNAVDVREGTLTAEWDITQLNAAAVNIRENATLAVRAATDADIASTLTGGGLVNLLNTSVSDTVTFSFQPFSPSALPFTGTVSILGEAGGAAIFNLDDNAQTALANATLRLNAGAQTTVDRDRAIGSLDLNGGLLIVNANTAAPVSPYVLTLTGTLTGVSGTIGVDTNVLGGLDLPKPPGSGALAGSIFDLDNTALNTKVIVAAANSTVADNTTYALADSDGNALGQSAVAAYYDATGAAVAGDIYHGYKAAYESAAGGIVLDYGVTEISSTSATVLATIDPSGSVDKTLDVLLSGDGAGFIFTGTETMTLAQRATYTGATRITGSAALRAAVENLLKSSGSVTIAAGAGFDDGGLAQTLNNLSGAGRVDFAAATLTVANSAPGLEFAGNIAGTGTLVLGGAGGWTLSGSTTVDQVLVTSAGPLTNTGRIMGAARGVSFDATAAGGSLLNSGTITAANGAGIYSNSEGVLITNLASGLIRLVDGSGVVLQAGGTVVNAGRIGGNGANSYGVYSSANATLVSNTTHGLIEGRLQGVHLGAGGTVANSGTIDGTSSSLSYGIYGGVKTTITNNATGLISAHVAGIYLSGEGTIVNSGTIFGTGVNDQGIYGGANVTITNETGGLIRGGTAGIQMVGSGTVVNRGTISGTIELSSGILGADDVTITNEATGLIRGGGYGIYSRAGGTITNSGTIISSSRNSSTGIRTGSNTTITNNTTGLIQGIYVSIRLDRSGTIINSGTIFTAGQYGIFSSRESTITNNATGLIQGGTDAIYLHSHSGTVANSGRIIGDNNGVNMIGSASANTIITNTTMGLIQGGVGGILVNADNAIVINSGTIIGTRYGGIQIGITPATIINNATGLIKGDLLGAEINMSTVVNSGAIIGTTRWGLYSFGSTITNAATGLIQGGTMGINMWQDDTIANSGTIIGTGTASYGIFASNTVTVTNTTGGLIQGAIAGIYLLNGGTVTNAGVISGTRNSFYGGGHGVYSAKAAAHITNEATGLLRGESAGVELAAGGVIINSGSIINTAIYNVDAVGIQGGGAPVRLTNNATGLISGDRFGVRLADGGEITNSGTIESNEYAVTSINESMLVTNTTGGLITGDRAGVLLQAGGTVANSGTIDGAVGVHAINTGVEIANATGGLIQGGTLGLRLQAGGGVTNSGTIIGEAITGISSRDEATITNDATGFIQGGMFGIFLGSGGTVTNSGAIRAPGVPGDFYAFGIEAEDEAVITNNAGGLIQGADVGVGLVNGGTLTNSGTISGITDAGVLSEEGRTVVTNMTGGVIIGGTYAIDLFEDAAHEVHLWNSSTLVGQLSIAGDASQLVLNGASGSEQAYTSAVTGSTTFTGTLVKQGEGGWIMNTDGLDMRAVDVREGHLTVEWDITQLNDAAVNVAANATLGVFAENDATVANTLTGDGLVGLFNTSDTQSITFTLDAGVGDSFTGTIGVGGGMQTARLNFDDNAETALSNATLWLTENSEVTLDADRSIGGLDFAGGAFVTRMENNVITGTLTVGSLGASGASIIVIDDIGPIDLDATAPAAASFFDQDDGDNLQQIIAAGVVESGAGAQLAITTVSGSALSGGTVAFGQAITDASGALGTAYYDFFAKVSDEDGSRGVYLTHGLTRLDADTGKTIVLSNSDAADNTLGAQLTGAGSFEMRATGGVFIGNALSNYTGATGVTSGTVIASTNNAFGNTSLLDLAANTGVDLNGKTQTVGAFNGASTSTLNLNSGSLAILSGGTSSGALTGGGTLTLIGGVLDVTNSNNGFSAAIENSGTLKLREADAVGVSGTIANSNLVLFDAARGDFAKSVSGDGNVRLSNSATITLTGTNTITASGSFIIDTDSRLTASQAANTGAAAIANSGVFVADNAATWDFANALTGSGELVKQNTGSLVISQSNVRTGATTITGGTLTLAHLGGLGSGNITNNATLALTAAGTYSNTTANAGVLDVRSTGVDLAADISGSGTNRIASGAAVTISGNNTGFDGKWDIIGDMLVNEQNHLDTAATDVSGTLRVESDTIPVWAYENVLTGAGVVAVDLAGGALNFAASAGTNFNGTIALASTGLDFTNDAAGSLNEQALARATVRAGSASNVRIARSGTIGGLTMAGGTLGIAMDVLDPAHVFKAGTIAVADSSSKIILEGLSGTLTPSGAPQPSTNFLDQDGPGAHAVKLVDADTVTQEGQMEILREDGSDLGAGQKVNYDGVVIASYEYAAFASATSITGGQGAGLYYDYLLTELDIQQDKTLALDTTGATNSVLDARVTGAGDLHISATGGSITLNNSDNDYAGETVVTADSTLVAGKNNVLGNSGTHTALLRLENNAAALLGNTEQIIGALNTAASSTLDLGDTGALTIVNGGAATGALTGGSLLELRSGTFTVTAANTGFTANVTIAEPVMADLKHVSALGTGDIAVGGTLRFDITESGTIANTLSGTGEIIKTNSGTAVIAAANTEFQGRANVELGRLVLEDIAALNTADISVAADAILEYHNASGVMSNNVTGAGTLAINTSGSFAIAHDNAIDNVELTNAVVYLSATNALGGSSARINVRDDSAIWFDIDQAQLGATVLNNSKLGFVHSGATFRRATLASLSGDNGALVFNVDFTNASGLKADGEVADHLTITNGSADGAHIVEVNPVPGDGMPAGGETAIPLITDAGVAIYHLHGGKVDFGLTAFELNKGSTSLSRLTLDPDKWYLLNTGLSDEADAIINTASMLAKDWHYSLDALYLRMGNVRAELTGVEKPTGNLWLRGRGYYLDANNTLSGRGFDQYVYGLTAGGDKAFRARSSVNLIGGFVDMGNIDRDFDAAGSEGETRNLSVGIYATWLHDNGWYADLVLKVDRYKNSFEARTAGNRQVRGDYNSNAEGVSLEFGRRIERRNGWWFEPGVQAAVVWLNGANYRTTPEAVALDVKVDGSRAAQYRGQVRFGRQITNSKWSPYGKFGLVRTDTDGGDIHANDKTFAPDYDGWRFETGFGASYLIDPRSQVYLDYEYNKASHYERPWSINLGYRRLW